MATAVAQVTETLMSIEEFLAWRGGETGVIYELVHGTIRAQDAASDAHGTIQGRLTTLIAQHLDAHRPGSRLVVTPGVKPRLLAAWNHRVPEMAVTCRPTEPGQKHIPDPTLIVEILSPSNKNDTWSNVPLYASLPSVLEILIVDSETVAGELLRRQADDSWPPGPEPIAPDGTVRLDSIGLEFPLAAACRDTYLA